MPRARPVVVLLVSGTLVIGGALLASRSFDLRPDARLQLRRAAAAQWGELGRCAALTERRRWTGHTLLTEGETTRVYDSFGRLVGTEALCGMPDCGGPTSVWELVSRVATTGYGDPGELVHDFCQEVLAFPGTPPAPFGLRVSGFELVSTDGAWRHELAAASPAEAHVASALNGKQCDLTISRYRRTNAGPIVVPNFTVTASNPADPNCFGVRGIEVRPRFQESAPAPLP